MADPVAHPFAILDELLAERAGDNCDAELASLKAEVARLRADLAAKDQTIATLRERVVMADEELAIYRNPKLGASRSVAAAVARIFRSELPTRHDPAGYRAPLAKVKDIAGVSEDAVSRQLTALAGMTTEDGTPVLIKEVITVPETTVVDETTGEIVDTIPLHRETWIGPGVDRAAFAKTLASLNPAVTKKWGGKRTPMGFCPEHPNAQINKRTRYECAVCDQPITDDTLQRLTRQQYEDERPEPKPQDAGTTLRGRPPGPDSTLVAVPSHQTRKMPVWSDPPPETMPVEPAYLSQAFAPPAPPDKHTSLGHGRRAP